MTFNGSLLVRSCSTQLTVLCSLPGDQVMFYSVSKVLTISLMASVIATLALVKSDDYYSYDEDSHAFNYNKEENVTEEEYDVSEGRDDHFLEDPHSAFAFNHKNHHSTSTGLIHELASLLNHHKPHHPRPFLHHKKRKHIKGKRNYLIPLILIALAKLAQILPVAKLTLLALFALVLFSKKALLVSVGSLILVIYDSFYRNKHSSIGVNIVKDRGSTAPIIGHEIATEDHGISGVNEPWLARGETIVTPKLHSEDGLIEKGDKWTRWWAPQINHRKKIKPEPLDLSSSRTIRDEGMLFEDLEEFIYDIKL